MHFLRWPQTPLFLIVLATLKAFHVTCLPYGGEGPDFTIKS